MKIPNVAYETEFIGFSSVSYFPKKNSNEESLREVKLPKWLTDLISVAVSEAKQDGRNEVRQEIRKALNIS